MENQAFLQTTYDATLSTNSTLPIQDIDLEPHLSSKRRLKP